jgi:hypothetical protein
VIFWPILAVYTALHGPSGVVLSPSKMPTLLTQAPSRSLDQRLDALDRANRIRVQRAQLKRELKSGQTSFDRILLDPPDYVLTAKVYDMLLSVPRLGRVRAGRLLTQCRISQAKTIGGLSERQRGELVDLFNS